MDSNFNIVNDYDQDDNSDQENRKSGSSYLSNNTPSNNIYKRSNFFSPTLSVSNDAMGLDMLMNNNNTLSEDTSDKSEDKVNVFNSSDEDDEDEDEDEDVFEKNNSFTPSYFNNNGMENSGYQRKTQEEINNEKTELLYQFDRMEKKRY